LKSNAYVLSEKDHPATGEKVLSVKPLASVPTEFQLIIGDFIHNLRSALDVLAFDLAWAGSKGPMIKGVAANSEFPVFGPRSPSAAELRKRIGTIDPAAQAIIESLQPHKRADGFEG